MITSDIQELNISDLNEYEEDRAVLLTENEGGYWRKLTLDPNKNATGTGYPFAYQDNEVISTTNIDESYNNRVSDGTQHIDMYYDFSSGIPTWGLQTSDSGTFRWEPDNRRSAGGIEPKISVDSQGNSWFIIKHIDTNRIRVLYYDSIVNDWTTVDDLDTQPAPTASPDIALSDSGIAIAAWVHDTGLNRQIQAAYYDPATTSWTSNIDLSVPTATEDANPVVAINDSGNGVAVWQSPQPDGSILMQAALFDGATKTWQGFPTTISLAVHENINPRVGMDDNGNIIAVWEHDEVSGNSLIKSAVYDAATTSWGLSATISNTNNESFPELSVTSNGDAMAVWITDFGSGYTVTANKYDGQSKTWKTITYDIDVKETGQYPAKVGMSNLGTATVIYSKQKTAGAPGQYYIQASHYDPDTDTWESPAILDETTVANSLPDVAMNDIGNAVAIWIKENPNTTVSLYSSTYQELIKKWSLPDQISAQRDEIFTTQAIINGNRAASIYQTSDIGNPFSTGAVATINPNILTANDSIVSFAFRKIQEVGEPEVDTDAATKFYVDSAIAAANGVFLEQLNAQGLLKEGALEALNKKADPVKEEKKEAKKTKKGKK